MNNCITLFTETNSVKLWKGNVMIIETSRNHMHCFKRNRKSIVQLNMKTIKRDDVPTFCKWLYHNGDRRWKILKTKIDDEKYMLIKWTVEIEYVEVYLTIWSFLNQIDSTFPRYHKSLNKWKLRIKLIYMLWHYFFIFIYSLYTHISITFFRWISLEC